MSETDEPKHGDRDADFLLNQYTTLRGELNRHYDKQHWWLAYTTATNGAIYLWILEKAKDNTHPHAIALILLLASIFATMVSGSLCWVNRRTANWITKYLEATEKVFISNGWETFFRRRQDTLNRIENRVGASNIVWIILAQCILSVLFVLLVIFEKYG